MFIEFTADNSSCLPWLWSHAFSITLQVCVQSEAGQRSHKLTVTAVKEFSDDGGTAGRPWASAVDLNERGRHHVVVLQFPKHVGACLHVIVRHVEHVSCCGGKCRKAETNQVEPGGGQRTAAAHPAHERW